MKETKVVQNRGRLILWAIWFYIACGVLCGVLFVVGIARAFNGGDPDPWFNASMVFGVFSLGITVVGIYLSPTLHAIRRNVVNKEGIVVLNVLLGWTFLGWIVALIWAFADTKQDDIAAAARARNYTPAPRQSRAPAAQRTCPNCGVTVGQTAVRCTHCSFNLSRRMKVCPHCGEDILQSAIKCRYCKSNLGG